MLILPSKLLGAQEAFEPAQIALHARPDERVDGGGRGALVFAIFAHDLVRQRDEAIGIGRAQNLADAPLMRRIGVGVQQAHRHRLDLVGGEELGEARHLVLGQRNEHLAPGVHPLGDLEGQFARDERLRPMKEQIEGLDAVAAPDRIGVAEAARGDQRGASALLLQHRVDGDGRAVQDLVERGHLAAREAQALGDAAGRIGRHGRGLRGDDAAVDAAHQVGESSPDIDADDVHAPP